MSVYRESDSVTACCEYRHSLTMQKRVFFNDLRVKCKLFFYFTFALLEKSFFLCGKENDDCNYFYLFIDGDKRDGNHKKFFFIYYYHYSLLYMGECFVYGSWKVKIINEKNYDYCIRFLFSFLLYFALLFQTFPHIHIRTYVCMCMETTSLILNYVCYYRYIYFI